jgi:hypothetical protein
MLMEDIKLPKMIPARRKTFSIIEPKILEDLKSIVKEVAKRNWYAADWPMNCKLCGATYKEGHHDSCLVKRAKEVLEKLK